VCLCLSCLHNPAGIDYSPTAATDAAGAKIGAIMGRTARRPGPPSFLFGVWGDGETSAENIEALLSEHIEGLGEITPRFVIPCDKEITSDTHLAVFEFAETNGYAVEVVQAAAPRVKALREMKDYAEKIHEADDADNPIEKVFADTLAAKAPDNAQLLFLWAEVDGEPVEEDQRVLFACIDGGVVALDLTQGLDALGTEGDDSGGDGNEPEGKDEPGGDEPEESVVREWPIRRLRQYAEEIQEEWAKDKKYDGPSADEVADMGKTELLEFLYGQPDPEPEQPKGRTRRAAKETEAAPEDDGKGVTPRRARQMRESSEAEGTDSTSRNRRAAAKKTAEPPAPEPEAGGEGEDTRDALLEQLSDAVAVLFPEAEGADGEIDAMAGAIIDIFEVLSDVVIDRIAARVEREPDESAVRQEIAPKRPPGKPRKDGATPTRRRTRP
jgi:hypothetical protein